MPAPARITRCAVGFVVAVILGSSPVGAQSAARVAGAVPKPRNTALDGGHWVIGALIDPFAFGGLGSVSTGPAVGGSSSSGGGTTVTTFGAAGTVGYMVLVGLDVGARLAYAQTSASGGGFTSSSSFTSLGAYARYWLPVSESGAFQFAAQYTSRETSSGLKSTSYGPIVGYSIFLNKHVSLDMLVPVELSTFAGSTTTVTTYGLNLGLSVFMP